MTEFVPVARSRDKDVQMRMQTNGRAELVSEHERDRIGSSDRDRRDNSLWTMLNCSGVPSSALSPGKYTKAIFPPVLTLTSSTMRANRGGSAIRHR
jgi:hypothetical protein